MNRKRFVVTGVSGSVFWRLLIIILSVAVVLSVLIPQLNQKREEADEIQCRDQMTQVADAQDTYKDANGVYAEYADSLLFFLPDTTYVTCPTDGRPYIMSAVDSTSYTISCPNGHGMISTGKKSWEKK